MKMRKVLAAIAIVGIATTTATSLVSCNSSDSSNKGPTYNVWDLNTWGKTQKDFIANGFKRSVLTSIHKNWYTIETINKGYNSVYHYTIVKNKNWDSLENNYFYNPFNDATPINDASTLDSNYVEGFNESDCVAIGMENIGSGFNIKYRITDYKTRAINKRNFVYNSLLAGIYLNIIAIPQDKNSYPLITGSVNNILIKI